MYLRINGLALTPVNGYGFTNVAFGNAGDPQRTFTALVRCYGTSDANARALAGAVARELCRSKVTVVAYRSAGTMADAVGFTTRGAQPHEMPVTVVSESRNRIDISVSLAIGSAWLDRANRVLLGSPIGDEFPTSTDVVRNNAKYVYADSGRWCVTTDTSDEGDLKLYFDTIDGEFLVIEFEYDVQAIAGASQALTVNAVLPSGASSTYTWPLVSAGSVGRGRYIGTVRVPSATTDQGYLHITTANHAGAVTAYITNVRVGVKTIANERVVPGAPSTSESTIPYGWTAQGISGAVFTYASGKFVLTCATNSSAASCIAYGTQGVTMATKAAAGTGGMVPVVAGRRYGWRGTLAVTAYTDGTVGYYCAWYQSDGTYISTDTLSAKTGTFSEATLYGEVTAPAKAAYASPLFGVTAANATLTATLKGVDFGEHILEAPGHMHLTRIGGEAPASLHIVSTPSIENAAQYVGYGIDDDYGAGYWSEASGATGWKSGYVIEAEHMTTTAGGSTIYGFDNAVAAAHGGKTRYHNDTNYSTHYFRSDCYRGPYKLRARWLSSNASGTITVGTDKTPDGFATSDVNFYYWYLGQIAMPTARTLPGTATYLGIKDKISNATYYVHGDCLFLLPIGRGWAEYWNAVGGGITATLEVDESGRVLVDGAVNAYGYGVPMTATNRDILVIGAGAVYTAPEATHLMRQEVYATERYSLWR